MPTIKKPNEYFGVLTYTGDGSSSATRSNTSAVNFTPDFVWIKQRSGTANHNLFDINRVISGDHKRLYSNDTSAEESSVYLGTTNLNGFINGGFTTGNGTNTNNNGSTYVAWNWKAGGASTVNTSGSISSNVSVNTTAGFSVVTYTGNGTGGATVGHGLGLTPKMIIAKGRGNTDNWPVYHASANASPATGHLLLNSTAAFTSTSTTWNNTAPTSTVFSVGTDPRINQNTIGYVAYCFAEVEGYSKFGSYVANASSDGPFIYTGFRPRWIMFKRTTSSTNWYVIDTAISPYNASTTGLYPNTSDAESSEGAVDILSNGFKCRVSSGAFNYPSGETFMYAAFAESPLKYSNAR